MTAPLDAAPPPFATVAAYALLPAAATLVGGLAAALRPPGPQVRSALQHLAAGVVVAVVAVELLPEVRRGQHPAVVAAGFALGVAAMMGLKWLTGGDDHEGPAGRPWGLVAGVGVDLALDGLLLGVGFAAGARAGALLSLALAAECLTLGLATAATLAPALGRPRAAAVTAGLAVGFLAGAAVGATVLAGAGGAWLAGVLAFGCAALLYLVTEELLAEAHEVPETPAATALFFIGFLAFLLLGMAE